MQFVRFTQPANGLDVILPRPKEINKPLETKSVMHHLATGRSSTGNNTNLFIKYALEYKDGINREYVENFILLYLADDRGFRYYPESTDSTFENVYIIGKLSLTFLHAQISHCHNLKMELFSNGAA